MPLSKARMRTRKRKDRLSNLVKPKVDALQSTTRPLKEESNGKLPVITGTLWIEDIVEFVDSASEDSGTCIDADGEPIPEMT